MSAPAVTAHWPVPSLVTSLSRAGWGPLAGREGQGVRSTLRGLMDLLPHRSGQGLVTAAQVAETAGLSERWVRTCLHLLEDAGIITWSRGGVVEGRPTPSFIRIVKRALVELIHAARSEITQVRADRAKTTRARIERLRWAFQQRSRRSAHAALSGSPDPLREGPARPVPPEQPSGGPPVEICHHGGDARRLASGLSRCPMCRREEAAHPRTAPAPDYATAAAADDTLWED